MSSTALEAFARGDLGDWRGLPSDLPVDEVLRLFDPIGGEGRAPLGSGEAGYVLARGGVYSQPVRVWMDRGSAIVADVATPELVDLLPGLRAGLGAAEVALAYRWGTVPVESGEWVYTSRGLTLFVNTDATRLVHVAVYSPAAETDYEQRLRIDLAERHLPRRGRA